MDKICAERALIIVATSCHLLDEILQWSFTDRSYILALAFYQSCYARPFLLYHHAIIGWFYFHVSKELSLPGLYVIFKVRELCNVPSSFVLVLQNLPSCCHESDGACTSDDGSASRWTLRAVAALLSSNPYPDLHTRRRAVKPPVNSSCFSPMQPAAAERGNEWYTSLDLEAPTLVLDHVRWHDGLMVASQYLMVRSWASF